MLVSKKSPIPSELTAAPFIVGVARSGTTLLRMMLDAHPQMAIPPETHFIPEVVNECRGSTKNPREVFIQGLISSQRWNDFQLQAAILRERVEVIEPFEIGSGLRTFYQLYAERFGKGRWGDKTPTYITQMLLIAGLLPEACFIHVIRDGRDVALSVKGLWFGPGSIVDAAETWRGRIQSAREQSAQLSNYLEIRYEDLLRATETTLRKICDFIELPWDSQVLDYHQGAEERLSEMSRDMRSKKGELRATAEQRLSIHALTTKPPETSRIGRWKQEMSVSDRDQFEKIAGPILSEFGYLD